MKRIVLFIVVIFLAGGCNRASSDSTSPQEAPRSAGGTTDAAFDWENPHPAPGHRNWADSLTFRSTKTLDQTTPRGCSGRSSATATWRNRRGRQT